jgi:hypothetical protein
VDCSQQALNRGYAVAIRRWLPSFPSHLFPHLHSARRPRKEYFSLIPLPLILLYLLILSISGVGHWLLKDLPHTPPSVVCPCFPDWNDPIEGSLDWPSRIVDWLLTGSFFQAPGPAFSIWEIQIYHVDTSFFSFSFFI